MIKPYLEEALTKFNWHRYGIDVADGSADIYWQHDLASELTAVIRAYERSYGCVTYDRFPDES